MDDEFSPRRRDVKREAAFSSLKRLRTDLNLAEILIVFTTTSALPAFPGLYDPVSVSLRALFLCELVLRAGVSLDSQKILTSVDSYMPIDEVHDEVYAKIKNSKKLKAVDKWLLLLNGESYSLKKDKYHVKNARKRIGKLLISKNILKKQKSKTREFIDFVTSRASGSSVPAVACKGVKSKISTEIITYLTGTVRYEEKDVLKLDILVCSFVFCNVMEDVYLTLPPSAAEIAQKKVRDIITRYTSSLGDSTQPTEWGIYCIMRSYLKLGTWI
ncbi:golgi phosphoprotein 3 [Nematocida minor]|uniref:golgi phosphoprotein 3 n=1 Tax=Nematocida minor TaxID=1912983 RepID=UPI00221FB727|nr:golgi phosphoprotein 3 [Nematocida minor]XP_051332079.1 golgi phosphoprotein 3 [Nematocida minor]KAI5188809.1 golgi phosphoprotein 3 [Nematocida minor]KAI5188913.1 golgi phosphoprotein 3 [Nematocida minor]